jgi:hypothetical protein
VTGDGVRRYLVVANQTLGGDELIATVREAMAIGTCAFHILVPATPSPELYTFGLEEEEGDILAKERLADAFACFERLGAPATGIVGPSDPMEAIREALEDDAFDEVILSTLPPGPSRWLREDLPNKMRAEFNVVVHHVIGEPKPPGA